MRAKQCSVMAKVQQAIATGPGILRHRFAICLSISQGLTSVVWPPQLQLHFQTLFFFFWPYPQFPALVMARISWMQLQELKFTSVKSFQT